MRSVEEIIARGRCFERHLRRVGGCRPRIGGLDITTREDERAHREDATKRTPTDAHTVSFYFSFTGQGSRSREQHSQGW